ncbi:hypothetical protein OM076_35685 [Solirubrobacter ginsenosidimutans]|uniref:Uncharacterized protein n=1 Tax=Solirubrobacter ginsenosidimutans TaxID=490573 RepID=A0A9X3MZK7_9ACTN|nr:hypothetical protein [Solirubrobacter ginsenosidimutans]MDA0165664.1 hypothetical protein [Solirubrobacter ginsenosidimutans]
MPPLDLSLPHSATEHAYRTWSSAQRDCGEHLRMWREAGASSARTEAFLSYRLALAREEQAAGELERVVSRRLAA